MLRRIVRYTLLILTLLLAGVWVWSYSRLEQFHCNNGSAGWEVTVVAGHIFAERYDLLDASASWTFEHKSQPNDVSITSDPFYIKLMRIKSNVTIPMWMISAPFALVTVILWYRPIRDRVRRKKVTGFEVEAKAPLP